MTNIEKQFVVVYGTHSSGSSCLAGILWHLGVYFGPDLQGHYGNEPGVRCGYESKEIESICEMAYPFPSLQSTASKGDVVNRLTAWKEARLSECPKESEWIGLKYPTLLLLKDVVREVFHPIEIFCFRDSTESLLSMLKRCPDKKPEDIAALNRCLDLEGCRTILSSQPIRLVVRYQDMVGEEQRLSEEVGRIASFLNIRTSCERVSAAIDSVDSSMRHVNLETCHHEPLKI
jgi:hypothetical protein